MDMIKRKRCNCDLCPRENCIHRGAYRRYPMEDGGCGLCPNLQAKYTTIVDRGDNPGNKWVNVTLVCDGRKVGRIHCNSGKMLVDPETVGHLMKMTNPGDMIAFLCGIAEAVEQEDQHVQQ